MSTPPATPAASRRKKHTRRHIPAEFSVEKVMSQDIIRGGFCGRASVDITGAETSVKGQVAYGKDQAKKHRITLPPEKIWVDNDIGASPWSKPKGARDGWTEMLSAIRADEIDVLIMTETSRTTRDPEEWGALLKACQRHCVLMLVGGTLYNPLNPDHATMLGISNVIASGESHRTLWRSLRGIDAAAKAGRPSGKAEWGYIRRYDQRGALVDVVPDPELVPIVREIFARYVRGVPVDHICAWLNTTAGELAPSADGPCPVWTPSEKRYRDLKAADPDRFKDEPPRKPKKWHAALLVAIIDSPRWMGCRWRYDKIVPAMWDGIWDTPEEGERIWYQAQKRRASAKTIATRSTATLFVTGIGRCGKCWAPLKGQVSIDRYMCKGTGIPGEPSGCVSAQIGVVDEIVSAAVIVKLSDTRLVERYREGLGQAQVERGKQHEELERLRAELAALPDLVESEGISLLLAAAEEKRLKKKIARLEAESVPETGSQLVADLVDPDPVRVVEAWEGLTIHQKRAVLLAVTDRHKLSSGEEVPHLRLLPIGTGRRRSVQRPQESVDIQFVGG